ncbi:MAG: AGE family epimerase/isomerase [Pseudomonadota bacterium]
MPKIIPVIMCGGSGTRLWPLSRSEEPKQLQVLFGEHSLLLSTAIRLHASKAFEPTLIICGQIYSDEVERQLSEANVPIGAILEEPMGRDTAAVGAIAARWVKEAYGDDAIMVLLPADHFVGDVPAFHQAILDAAKTAMGGYITTIGITPSGPETGFGYILRKDTPLPDLSGYAVDRFVEKPDLETAKTYVEHGGYAWNAGIFVVKGSLVLSELATFEPDISDAVNIAFEAAVSKSGKNGSQRLCLQAETFSKVPKKSIDYAIMEQTRHAAVVLAQFGWSDVGNWGAVRELGIADDDGNVAPDKSLLVKTRNSLVQSSTDRLISLVGMSDIVVVDTPDALMICSHDAAQDVKKVHTALVDQGASSAYRHTSEAPTFETRCRGWARKYFFDIALPRWAEDGVDREMGGVHEALDHSGTPLSDMPKRFRVQARQVYTYAHAYTLGWARGIEALIPPLNFMLEHCWMENGGWGHTFNRDGSPLDASLDTYDHAFALLALGWAYKVTGEKDLLNKAKATMSILRTELRHPQLGYIEGIPAKTARRANPHMHLFEAAMHWMALHQDEEMADLADEIFQLYTEHLCVDGLLREYFNDDLSLLSERTDPALLQVEPGHLIEWAFLLNRYEQLTGKASQTTSTLEAFGEAWGTNRKTGLLMDQCGADGRLPETVLSRLWPQTEYVRLKLMRPEPEERIKGLEMLERVKEMYLSPNGTPDGIWFDQLDQTGNVISKCAPASSFYHLLGCLEPLIT